MEIEFDAGRHHRIVGTEALVLSLQRLRQRVAFAASLSSQKMDGKGCLIFLEGLFDLSSGLGYDGNKPCGQRRRV